MSGPIVDWQHLRRVSQFYLSWNERQSNVIAATSSRLQKLTSTQDAVECFMVSEDELSSETYQQVVEVESDCAADLHEFARIFARQKSTLYEIIQVSK